MPLKDMIRKEKNQLLAELQSKELAKNLVWQLQLNCWIADSKHIGHFMCTPELAASELFQEPIKPQTG